jgi:penicillin-binding protein 2
MALEEGVVTPDQTVFCPGYMELGDHRFHCWKHGGHGRIGLVNALAQSCDVYFYEMAKRLGIEKIAESARRFGLGQRLNVDLPGERPGIIPDRDWKEARFGTSWQQGETLIAAIGQGYVLATPLQLATMTSRLVNGGRAVLPRLTASIGGLPTAPASEYPPIGFSPSSLDYAVQGMVEVMTRGTAKSSQIHVAGFEMGGKTGTSQVRRITMAERAAGLRLDEWPWEQRDHALFVGFAPVGAPRYACSVIVEHGGGGSSVAAPIARDILQECQQRQSGREIAATVEVGRPAAG